MFSFWGSICTASEPKTVSRSFLYTAFSAGALVARGSSSLMSLID